MSIADNSANFPFAVFFCQTCTNFASAKGFEVKLATCGFPLSKTPQPTVLGTPEIKVENGGSGEMISSTPAVNGAAVYKHLYSSNPAEGWQEILTTRASCKIPGLVPGETYSMRIMATGSFDQVTMSNVVTKMAA